MSSDFLEIDCSESFRCISCNKTYEELKKGPDDVPKTHTNFGLKGDEHQLCHACWTNIRRHRRATPKSKEKFRCAHCARTHEQLQELAKTKKYYGVRRRLPGESKKIAARYCGCCYAKLRKLPVRTKSQEEPNLDIVAPEKAYSPLHL